MIRINRTGVGIWMVGWVWVTPADAGADAAMGPDLRREDD